MFSLVILVIALIVVTLLALESGGVVTVYTPKAEGGTHRATRIWFATESGRLYLEAGSPENPWVKDLDSTTSLKIEGQDLDGWYVFRLDSSARGHQVIRTMMRSRYGWRDWWIGVMFDTSESQLIELEPKIAPQD